MPNKFLSPSGDLEEVFITDYQYIDRLFNTGSLWVWGNNYDGQLGINSNSDSRSSPVQTVSGGTNWKQISSTNTMAAIKTDGTLWLWGINDYGQLGVNDINYRSSPVQTTVGGSNWQQVACGEYHTSAIKTDGTLWAWGYNGSGALGDGTVVDQSTPTQIGSNTNWKQVECGNEFTAAIKTDGTLWLWGNNDYGKIGDNTLDYKSSPVQIYGGGTNWKQVACGASHAAAIKTDGTLWLWGRNYWGQLGDNTTGAYPDFTLNSKSSPVQTIAGGTNWMQVSCGFDHIAAIKSDGTLWLWGDNSQGQLGDSTTDPKSSPVQIYGGGTNWKQISASTYYSPVAIKTDGTLWTWGNNSNGQLGINNTTNKTTPVQTIMGGTNWRQAASGLYSMAAITF